LGSAFFLANGFAFPPITKETCGSAAEAGPQKIEFSSESRRLSAREAAELPIPSHRHRSSAESCLGFAFPHITKESCGSAAEAEPQKLELSYGKPWLSAREAAKPQWQGVITSAAHPPASQSDPTCQIFLKFPVAVPLLTVRTYSPLGSYHFSICEIEQCV